MIRLLPLVALLAITSALQAQGPSADWRIVTTKHFRVYYPQPYEEWATRAASRLESIRSAVVSEVGFDPSQVIDVIVSNPIAQANGSAWPILDAPRIIFYTEPPGPEELIGAYSDWIDVLAVHEVAHIVHMLRPSRNPLNRLIERLLLPLNGITLGAPRWVLEGYATVVEGRLTGAGRPPGAMRAIVLRTWAANGRMPSYAQLDSDTRFLGMSMAYLAGSAYLEWLERRAGEGSLRRLWARMTARESRDFSSAFQGVFGETPERLYGQFVAELTSSAVAVNRATAPSEGDLWQDTPRGSGDPAVSPDGSRIVVALRPRNAASRLVIWSTEEPQEERKKFTERISRMIARDPEDYAPVAPKPLPRKVRHSLTPKDGGDVDSPRWTHDGKSILYSHRQPDREGFLHRDLFLWTPSSGENRRITALADVFDADPLPDGRRAVAVRSRFGRSQLVMVDLTTGVVQQLTPLETAAVYSHPRVHADGARVAYVAHRGGAWTLRVLHLETKADKEIAVAGSVATPEWQSDDIIATILTGGFAELHRIAIAGTRTPLTRSVGAAFSPAPSPDGRVFFMSLGVDGFAVRVIDGRGGAAAAPAYDATLVPALPPVFQTPAPFQRQQLPAAHRVGTGRQETSIFGGTTISPSHNAFEAGIRIGDVLGRLDTIAIASLSNDRGQQGFGVASVWRGLPVDMAGHVYAATDDLVKREGGEVRGSWTAVLPTSTFRVDAGALAGRPFAFGFADTSVRMRQVLSSWRGEEELRLSGESGSLRHLRGVLRVSARQGSFGVAARYQHDEGRGEQGIEVGGVLSSILPRSAIPNRVVDPALPARTLTGRTYDGVRLEMTTPLLPATLFYQRHRAEGASLSLAGLQVQLMSAENPLLRFPALDLTAGVARALDEPLRNRTKWWLAMRWAP